MLECTVHNLKSNTTYHFQVRAHTKVGAGSYTNLIDVSTTHENRISQILVAHPFGIDIWDLDSKINVRLVDGWFVVHSTYSRAKHKIYWSKERKKLLMLEMNEKSIRKISNLKKIAFYFCIDWVARNLYWIELDKFDIKSHNIIKFDLTMWENGIIKYDKISKIRIRSYLTILPSMGNHFKQINISQSICGVS